MEFESELSFFESLLNEDIEWELLMCEAEEVATNNWILRKVIDEEKCDVGELIKRKCEFVDPEVVTKKCKLESMMCEPEDVATNNWIMRKVIDEENCDVGELIKRKSEFIDSEVLTKKCKLEMELASSSSIDVVPNETEMDLLLPALTLGAFSKRKNEDSLVVSKKSKLRRK